MAIQLYIFHLFNVLLCNNKKANFYNTLGNNQKLCKYLHFIANSSVSTAVLFGSQSYKSKMGGQTTNDHDCQTHIKTITCMGTNVSYFPQLSVWLLIAL